MTVQDEISFGPPVRAWAVMGQVIRLIEHSGEYKRVGVNKLWHDETRLLIKHHYVYGQCTFTIVDPAERRILHRVTGHDGDSPLTIWHEIQRLIRSPHAV